MASETRCHTCTCVRYKCGRGARSITAWGPLSPPRLRHIELEPQRQVGTTEMIIRPPPLQIGKQFARELCRGPRATPSARPPDTATGGVTQSKVDAFDESRVECAGETERFEAVGEMGQVAQAHAAFDPSFHSGQAPSESAAAIGFLDLAVQQVERHLPTEFARSHIRDPLTEMGGDRIEVEVEAVTGEDRQTARSQDERDGVKQSIGHVLGAWTELECRDQLGGRVKGDPHPQRP